jgi:hypothetical protein
VEIKFRCRPCHRHFYAQVFLTLATISPSAGLASTA